MMNIKGSLYLFLGVFFAFSLFVPAIILFIDQYLDIMAFIRANIEFFIYTYFISVFLSFVVTFIKHPVIEKFANDFEKEIKDYSVAAIMAVLLNFLTIRFKPALFVESNEIGFFVLFLACYCFMLAKEHLET